MLLIDQKPTGSRKGLFDKRRNSQRQRGFKVAYATNGGTVRWKVSASSATCTDKMSDGKATCKNRWTFDRVQSKSQLQAHLFERRRRATPISQKLIPGILMDSVLRAGERGGGGEWSSDLLIADCKTEGNCQPPIFKSSGSSTFHVQTDLSNPSLLINHHAAKRPPSVPLSKMNKTEEDIFRTGKRQRLL